MSQPFRIAFVGIDNPHGAGWRELLLNFQDEIEITAIVPAYGGTTYSLEERLAAVPHYETVEQLLAEGDFQGVLVALPNDTATDAVLQLASAGKHVLVEKPVAGSAEQAKQIAEVVAKSGIAFQTGFLWRYDATAERLREMVCAGRFGKLISLEMSFVTSDVNHRGPNHYLFDPKISTGGFFNWLACHYLDLMFYIVGEPVVGVTSRIGRFGATPVEVEDGGVAILDLAGGGVATFLGGYWLPRWAGECHWSLRGSQRWVHWRPAQGATPGVLEIHGPKPQWHAMEETFELLPDTTPGYGGRAGVALIADWLASIRTGSHACRNTAQTLLATLALIDTIQESSQAGRHITCNIT